MEKIKYLIEEELLEARGKFPNHNSPHEGYAVLLEEIEELRQDLECLEKSKSYLWAAVKENSHIKQEHEINKMKKRIILLIKEAIQVGAMIEKYE